MVLDLYTRLSPPRSGIKQSTNHGRTPRIGLSTSKYVTALISEPKRKMERAIYQFPHLLPSYFPSVIVYTNHHQLGVFSMALQRSNAPSFSDLLFFHQAFLVKLFY